MYKITAAAIGLTGPSDNKETWVLTFKRPRRRTIHSKRNTYRTFAPTKEEVEGGSLVYIVISSEVTYNTYQAK